MSDLDTDAPGDTTFQKYREESLGELQRAMESLFSEPSLKLRNFGGVAETGVFRFDKGTAADFHYKNLSGGEKAAFDVLLDIFVTRDEYQDAIYCIDEPEAHVATALHGALLRAIMDLIPDKSQLWIATHSIGFVRKAYDIMKDTGDVTFLDFSGHDFDRSVEMVPTTPGRRFWQAIYQVALDDLSQLIAPAHVIFCEGNPQATDQGFDARCYNSIFSDTHPDTLFISRGGASEVEKSENPVAILTAIAKGIQFGRLIDRDNMTEDARKKLITNGTNVLRRREIENYLYDPDVIATFLEKIKKQDLESDILAERQRLLSHCATPSDNVKAISRELFEYIRRLTRHGNLGKTRREFAEGYLIPALKETGHVFDELHEDIFVASDGSGPS